MLKIINRDGIWNKNQQQFLISQFIQPDRMFSKLLGKNKLKSEKISKFLIQNNIGNPEWLLNSNEIERLVKQFVYNLRDNIQSIYNKYDKMLETIYDKYIALKKFILTINGVETYKEMINIGFKEKYVREIQNSIILSNHVTKVYIRKINILHSDTRIEYIDFFKSFVKDMKDLLHNVNIGRLISILNRFSDNSKELLKVELLPHFNDHVYKMNVLNNKSINNEYKFIIPLIRTLIKIKKKNNLNMFLPRKDNNKEIID